MMRLGPVCYQWVTCGGAHIPPRVPLVTALVRYAHDLGIRVVAEGIETAGELELVRQLGSDYAQGYFLGRPAPHPVGLSETAAQLWPAP